MSLKPSSITDFLHKFSSFLAVAAAAAAQVPAATSWVGLLLSLTGLLGGAGLIGSAVKKQP